MWRKQRTFSNERYATVFIKLGAIESRQSDSITTYSTYCLILVDAQTIDLHLHSVNGMAPKAPAARTRIPAHQADLCGEDGSPRHLGRPSWSNSP